MAIYERITSQGRPGDPAKIPVHPFASALGEWAVGNVTRQQVIDAFTLDASDQTEIDAIAAAYTAKAAGAERVGYLWQLERAFILCESGHYTKAKAKAVLGF